MIQSMTGYGKSVLQLPTKKLSIEIKSLNSKSLDINARMPTMYREKELEIRKLIASKLVRGKVDFSLYLEITGEETTTHVNKPVVTSYMKQLKDVVDVDASELLQMAIRLPDAITSVKEDINENEWSNIKSEIKSALDRIETYRIEEGKVLESEFKERIINIDKLLEKVIIIDPERVEAVRDRLRKGIDEIKERVDENRFEQELVYYIEKFDITEEKVRLKNHLDYFIKTIDSKEKNLVL